MDEGTAGGEMETGTQRDEAVASRVSDVPQPVERIEAEMVWETDARRGRLGIKRQAQEQKNSV